MSDVKQVKVDNWGIYFLQRLKHFFNRTDYCDLTLQFQDNAQLKVHRLVLNACTEYFELLERTCEMYEDCLVMPDDLQADVVVPIVNFMYTGQLEFKMSFLERLYQTSLVMNMPVLTKLLDAHRGMHARSNPSQNYTNVKKTTKSNDLLKSSKYIIPNTSDSGKRSYNKAFASQKINESSKSSIVSYKANEINRNKLNNACKTIYRDKKYHLPMKKLEQTLSGNNGHNNYRPPSPMPLDNELYSKKLVLGDPRPTRYELPEELDTDNIFENSFSNISYTSKPLMVHPDSTKQYSSMKNNLYSEPSGSKKGKRPSTVDIVECKKVQKNDSLFEDDNIQNSHDDEMFQPAFLSMREGDPSQLFDQMLDNSEGPKVTIEGKEKQTGNLDHAKIISEVLKKYPHLVKGNKNIKLKILNTSSTKTKKIRPPTPQIEVEVKPKPEVSYTYETDVLDSKEAAKLIAMGAENVKGPWICLICGTPGKALNFTSYYNYRSHLVEVHNEKPVSSICEYCGLKSLKRNYLLHHIYTNHGIPPPPQYHFPKCNQCDYIALTEGFLVKHKLTHSDNKTVRCYVCSVGFSKTSQLLMHIQKTGHKFNSDKKTTLQCVYCMKVFLRESNFYVHLKTNHKGEATRDGIIEDSDDEKHVEGRSGMSHEVKSNIKHENSYENESKDTETQYQIHQRTDGNIHVSKKPRMSAPNTKHKILNPGFVFPSVKSAPKPKVVSTVNNEYIQEIDSPPLQVNEDNIVLIDGTEYIMKDNQLISKKSPNKPEYIISEFIENEPEPKPHNLEASLTSASSIEFTNIENADIDTPIQQSKLIKSTNLNQPIQIVVSNEEEYKALMSSNHSIIFDDVEANKTLTVLTAPHTTTIDNTGLELENTQSNDMMIIQDDYPLNVSEAVTSIPADSNYVVVYSSAVGHEDPSKQYQIITSQEIGTQYVQASDVITQNYETVTTSTPVMNTQTIEAPNEESWTEQTSNNQVTLHVNPLKSNDEIEKPDQSPKQINNESDTVVVELPEVQLSSSLSEATHDDYVTIKPISNAVDSETVNMEDVQNNANEVVVEEIKNNTIEPMEVDVSLEVIAVKENVTEELVVLQTDNEEIPQNIEVATSQNKDLVTAKQSHIVLNEQNAHELIEHQKEVNEGCNTEQLAANIVTAVSEVAELVPLNSENITVPKVVEQIQNIASEWSEDEYDIVEEEPIKETKNPVVETDDPEPEVEESIENIQQEMQKQLSCIANEEPDTDENLNSEENSGTNHQEAEPCDQSAVPTIPSVNVEATQVKITSLLNDWEDNDSQEENVSTNEKVDENEMQAEKSEETNDNNETRDLTKNDKIKSLVSDWDDEEEEAKE